MVLMGAVAHVDPEGVGAGLGELADHLRRVARRTQGGEDPHLAGAGHELAGLRFRIGHCPPA